MNKCIVSLLLSSVVFETSAISIANTTSLFHSQPLRPTLANTLSNLHYSCATQRRCLVCCHRRRCYSTPCHNCSRLLRLRCRWWSAPEKLVARCGSYFGVWRCTLTRYCCWVCCSGASASVDSVHLSICNSLLFSFNWTNLDRSLATRHALDWTMVSCLWILIFLLLLYYSYCKIFLIFCCSSILLFRLFLGSRICPVTRILGPVNLKEA